MSYTIDGKVIAAPENMTILEAARANGIEIPTLCYLKNVSNIGSCRLCMVEVSTPNRSPATAGLLLPACKTLPREGMAILTKTERLEHYRREMLKLLLSNHRTDAQETVVGRTVRRLRVHNAVVLHDSWVSPAAA